MKNSPDGGATYHWLREHHLLPPESLSEDLKAAWWRVGFDLRNMAGDDAHLSTETLRAKMVEYLNEAERGLNAYRDLLLGRLSPDQKWERLSEEDASFRLE